MTQKRLGAFRIEIKDDRMVVRRTSATRSATGCIFAVLFFAGSYSMLFLSVMSGRADYRIAYWSLGLGVCGAISLFIPFMFGSLRRVALILDRPKNEIRDATKKLSAIDTIKQVIVESHDAFLGSGLNEIRREKIVVYAEDEDGRIELAAVGDRATANQLADHISEYLKVPISFEQGDEVQLSPDDLVD